MITGYALILVIAGCGDNSAGSGGPLYDTSAKATSGTAINRDSVTAAIAQDSASTDSSPKKASSGGGVPAGTIDSGMTNAGAHKSMKHHKK